MEARPVGDWIQGRLDLRAQRKLRSQATPDHHIPHLVQG